MNYDVLFSSLSFSLFDRPLSIFFYFHSVALLSQKAPPSLYCSPPSPPLTPPSPPFSETCRDFSAFHPPSTANAPMSPKIVKFFSFVKFCDLFIYASNPQQSTNKPRPLSTFANLEFKSAAPTRVTRDPTSEKITMTSYHMRYVV